MRVLKDPIPIPVPKLSLAELRALCLEEGADDAGAVSLSRRELEDDRHTILTAFSAARSVVSLVCRMNPEPVRSPSRGAANQEFHTTSHEVNEVARRVVRRLAQRGVRAMNPPMAFPMEMEQGPGRIWTVSLKPLAVAAGMGRMGIHRNVIHPKFGNFILLGAVLLAAELDEESQPIDFNPCMNCKLCVAACPVGAISPEGDFNLASCYTHNYREFMGGFTDWVGQIADSRNALDYARRVDDAETTSMWQSLSYGANYKAAYCVSVCPAGEDVIAPFLADRPGFLEEFLKPLQRKDEVVYVLPDSDAEDYVKRRFPHKRTRRVGNVLRPRNLKGFLETMRHGFQPGRSKGLKARYHFVFKGSEQAERTVVIADQKITIEAGLEGPCDLRIVADGASWVRFLRKEVGLLRLLCTRKLILRGDPRLLAAFGRCFP